MLKSSLHNIPDMIYIIPTKRGIGVELWGNHDDLNSLYEFISKFWHGEDDVNYPGSENRDKLISGFSYEIRKAKDGSRLKRNTSHYSQGKQLYYGSQITWVDFLFSLTAIKYHMRFKETNKFDISQMLLLEFWLEKAMNTYDEADAKALIGFIDDGLYGANSHIYQCMYSINLDFLRLGGGKRAFRQLPELLKRGVYYTAEYKEYEEFLRNEAKKLGCESSELEVDDDDFNYENLKW